MDTDNACTILEEGGNNRLLLSAEHAGVEVPPDLGDLGIGRDELLRHIGYDIGIEGVIRHLHESSGHPAILGKYSRLVADVNRPEESCECVLDSSDGTPIQANAELSDSSRAERIQRYHRPFHAAFRSLILRVRPKCIVSLHSFTPMLRSEGRPRPWHCGVLYGSAANMAQCFIQSLCEIPGLVVGDNQPYRFDPGRFIVPRTIDGHRIPAVVIEIRQDLIESEQEQQHWSRILHGVLTACRPE